MTTNDQLTALIAELKKPEELEGLLWLEVPDYRAIYDPDDDYDHDVFAAALLDLALRCTSTVDDLAMLVRQLVHSLGKAAPDHTLPARAVDYLKRHGIQGSILRGDEADTTAWEVGRTLDALIAERDALVERNNALKAEVAALVQAGLELAEERKVGQRVCAEALAREKRLREYTMHKQHCGFVNWQAGEIIRKIERNCICGLDALLKEE